MKTASVGRTPATSTSLQAAGSVPVPNVTTPCNSAGAPGTLYYASKAGSNSDLAALPLANCDEAWTVRLPNTYPVVESITIAPQKRTGYVLAADASRSVAALIPFTLSNGKLEDSIPVGLPGAVAVAPNGTTAYVANSGDIEGLATPPGSTVTPVDLLTDRALQPIPLDDAPGGVAVTPDGKTLLVSLISGKVVPISTTDDAAGAPIALPISSKGFTYSEPITVDPVDDIALTGNGSADLVTPADVMNVVNLDTDQAESPIPLGLAGMATSQIIVSGNGQSAFALRFGEVQIIDLVSRTVTTTLNGSSMALSPDGQTLYVGQYPEGGIDSAPVKLVPVDIATGQIGPVVATLSAPPSAITVGP